MVLTKALTCMSDLGGAFCFNCDEETQPLETSFVVMHCCRETKTTSCALQLTSVRSNNSIGYLCPYQRSGTIPCTKSQSNKQKCNRSGDFINK